MDESTSLLWRVLPLAAGAAVSPALIGASVGILGAFGRRGVRMLALYLVGAALVVAAVLVVASSSILQAGRGSGRIADVVDLALGTALLLLAVVLAFRKPRPGASKTTHLLESRWAGVSVLGLGILMMLTNISTLVLVLAGGREVARASNPVILAVGEGMLLVGALLPVLLPLGWMLASPQRAARELKRLDGFLARHSRPIGVTVSALTGAYLVARGLGLL